MITLAIFIIITRFKEKKKKKKKGDPSFSNPKIK